VINGFIVEMFNIRPESGFTGAKISAYHCVKDFICQRFSGLESGILHIAKTIA
jgi:hypothetical protein